MDELLPILNRLREKFYSTFDEKALLTFVEPMSCRYANGNVPNSVGQSIQGFLDNPTQQTLLIQGAPGSGKTLLSQVEAHHRWQQLGDNSVKKEQPAPRVIPLWIWLPALLKEAKGKDLLHVFLEKQGLLASEIQLIQQTNQKGTLLIQLMLDGWDEVPVQDIELFTANGWWDKAWPHIKLIVTSRPDILAQYAGKHPGGYPSFFCQGNLQDNRFTECYLQPFATKQIHGYLAQYIKNTLPLKEVVILPPSTALNACDITPDTNALLCWEEVATYEHYITTLPGVATLAQVPFVLTLLVQVLPRIILETQNNVEQQDTAHQQALTHDKLYEYFTRQWLHQQACRLWENHSVKETVIRVMNIPEGAIPQVATNDEISHYQFERLKACLRLYSENLAKAAFNLGQGKLDVLLDDSITLHPDLVQADSQGQPFFKTKSLNRALMEIIRSGCLLKSQEMGKHVFLHKTLLEFFAAARLYRSVCTSIDWYVGNLSEDIIQEEFSLNAYSLNQEPKIITFLAEKVIANTAFKDHLYQVIEFSKQEPVVATASSNAITMLNAARENFAQKNFSGVRIPEANLTGALCSHTDFSYADCRGVNFSRAWLRGANLSGAYLWQAHFGVLTPITMKLPITTFAQSRDEQWLALGDTKGNVIVWDMQQQQLHAQYVIPLIRVASRVQSWMGSIVAKQVFDREDFKCVETALAFTKDSQHLLAVNAEHILYSITLRTHTILQKFSLWPLKKPPNINDLRSDKKIFILPDGDILYTSDELDCCYHISSTGEHQGRPLKNEIIICMSPDGTHCLTYNEAKNQQVLWDIQCGFTERKAVAVITSSSELPNCRPFGQNQCAAISRDNQRWAFMSYGNKYRQCSLRWVAVGNPIPQLLTQLRFTKVDGISLTFGITDDTLVIHSPKHTKLWDLNTQQNLQTFDFPWIRTEGLYLGVNKRYHQLLCLPKYIYSLLRYDLHAPTTSIYCMPKNSSVDVYRNDLRQEELRCEFLDKNRVLCQVSQQKIIFPNLNGFFYEGEGHVSKVKLILRMAVSDAYVALPYGYWNFTTSGTIIVMMAKKGNIIRKTGSFLICSFDTLMGNQKIFQTTNVLLHHRQYQNERLTIAYSVPMVRLAFSRDSVYLAGIDGGLDIVLWQLSISHEPVRLTAVRLWRTSPPLSKYFSLELDNLDVNREIPIGIAVQQQGVVVVNHLQRVFLLYLHNKKLTSMVYSMTISFSSLWFLDDTTLVCETQNKGIVVFQLLKVDENYRLSLIYSSELFSLQLRGCYVAGALGMISSQRRLFEYHKAIGQPANLAHEDNTRLVTTFSQGQWWSQINATKAVVSQSFYSQLLTGTLIDYDDWVATLVRDVNAKDGMHTFLLIEGITTFGKPCYVRIDLANRIGGKKVEPEGFAKIKFSYAVAENLSQQSLQQASTSDTILRRNPEGLKGQAWVVSRRQLVVLIEYIQQQYVIPDKLIPYSTLGDKSFFAKHHNCYTWVREMLLRLKHPPITKRLPKKWSNYIVNNPGFDLNVQLGAVAAQKDNSPDIVPDNSGLGSRQCGVM